MTDRDLTQRLDRIERTLSRLERGLAQLTQAVQALTAPSHEPATGSASLCRGTGPALDVIQGQASAGPDAPVPEGGDDQAEAGSPLDYPIHRNG